MTLLSDASFSSIIVPTNDSARYTFLLDNSLRHDYPVGPARYCSSPPPPSLLLLSSLLPWPPFLPSPSPAPSIYAHPSCPTPSLVPPHSFPFIPIPSLLSSYEEASNICLAALFGAVLRAHRHRQVHLHPAPPALPGQGGVHVECLDSITVPQPFYNRSTTVPQPFHNRSTTVPQPFHDRQQPFHKDEIGVAVAWLQSLKAKIR